MRALHGKRFRNLRIDGVRPGSGEQGRSAAVAREPRCGIRALHRRAVDEAGHEFRRHRPRRRPPCWHGWRRATSTTWMRPCRRRARHCRPGRGWAATRGPGSCTRWRARSRSIRGCSRCSRAWTTASRSARRATSTSRWSRATSTIMPGGRNSSKRSSRATAPWAWSGRSSRGTSRCSCWPGRSRRRSRPGTRWCSSPPSSRRSRRCCSRRWRSARGSRPAWSTW